LRLNCDLFLGKPNKECLNLFCPAFNLASPTASIHSTYIFLGKDVILW